MKGIQQFINWVYGLSADIFYKRFIKDTHNAGAVNREVLRDILSRNSKTVYGELYKFAQLNPDSFRKQVPITNYSDYEGYIDEIAAGTENVLTRDPVTYLGLSSGTTGKQKRIPMISRAQKIVNMSMMLLPYGFLRQAIPVARKGGRGLLLMNMARAENSLAGIATGTATSGGMSFMKKFLPYFWTTPVEILELPDQQDANYLHMLFALKERDLAYIEAPFASGVVQLLGVLEERYEELVEDIRRGRISNNIFLCPLLRSSLEARLTPSPLRAEELENALKKGIQGIVPRIWLKISYVACVTGGSFSVYEPRLRDYIGDLPLYSAIYAATEAMIGISPKIGETNYVVIPRSAYFEFVPVEEAEMSNPVTLDLTEVEAGKTYEIVVTNYAGLYRYRLGDVIRVLGFYHKSPVLEFLYRKGQLLNVAGEKTSEPAVQQAIFKTMDALNETLVDYTVTLDLGPSVGRYMFFLELTPSGKEFNENSKIQDILEKHLFETNPRYQAGIKEKRISPCVVRLVQPGTFQKIRYELIKRGASLNRVKIPRLIRDAQLMEMLNNNCLK